MSVRVNLLPRETYARQAAARQRSYVAAAGVALLVVLGAAYWMQSMWISDAEEEQQLAQQELDRLSAREAELAEFRELEQRVDQVDETLAATLAHEISFAAILQDIAVVTPADAAFTNVDATAIDATGPDGGAVRDVVARINANGESLRGHAPGVERLLIELDKIAAFFDIFVSDSTVDPDDEDVAIFGVEIDVGAEARTGRYQDGVPEALR